MSEDPIIGGVTAPKDDGEDRTETVIGGPPREDAIASEVARLLREALLAAHDDLAPEDLSGQSAADVRERYLAARERLDREAAEAPPHAPFAAPAGAPGRFAPAPATAFEKIREGLARLNP